MRKNLLISLLVVLLLLISCDDRIEPQPIPTPTPDPVKSDITYQLLVYSFCDSNGDGVGDFNGITSRLDYLKEMGVQAIWLSPIHPALSYHGYDVLDYEAINPEYGTENDFLNLVKQAHAKGIKIYLDYVLNHTSKEHEWFRNAVIDKNGKYRNWYIFSSDPASDIKAGRIAMIENNGYYSGEWTSCASGSTGSMKLEFTLKTDASGKPKSITAAKVDNISNKGEQNTGIYLYYGDGKMVQFYSDYTVSLDFKSDWGFLVRTSTGDSWPAGTKYGAKEGQQTLSWNTPFSLYPSTSSFDPSDILFPGMEVGYYHSVFGSYMPDINYGRASECENSEPFKALTAAADKWIAMGIDGFRLDAVKHIYHNASSDENPTFLKKFYDHCNATYKTCGGDGDFYMIGEHFSEAAEVAPYYKGLPAFFEFCFWWRLKDALNSGNGQSLVAELQRNQSLYAQIRQNYIAATKLSNHDEDRAGSDLQKNPAKMKLAAAVLLTCSGTPYIYQGEELGYWGTKSGGDEYVRTPIKWTRNGSVASEKLAGKIDNAMLSPDISVESQSADDNSVLNVYRKFAQTRIKYKALTDGTLGYCAEASGTNSVCAWFRIAEGQKILVVHNFGGGNSSVTFKSSKLDNMILSNGSVTVKNDKLTLGAWSSALFLQ